MAKKLFICSNLYENPQIIEENSANKKFLDTKMNPRIIKTANSKPARAACSIAREINPFFHPNMTWGPHIQGSCCSLNVYIDPLSQWFSFMVSLHICVSRVSPDLWTNFFKP